MKDRSLGIKNKTKTNRWLFTKQAINDFRLNGSIMPSSRALTEKMLKPVSVKDGMCLVELGAGMGNMTKEIIKRMPENSILLVFELNQKLADYLEKTIMDKRVRIINDDAAKISVYLSKYGFCHANYVISGLPLGNMKYAERQKILSGIEKALADDGRYIQFQYLLSSLHHIKKIFQTKISSVVLKNIPPAFVYVCNKYS